MKYAIYALIDPRTDEIKYIGVTSKPEQRLKAHVGKCKKAKEGHEKYIPCKNPLRDWFRQLSFADLEPTMRIIWYIKAKTSTEAKIFERLIIRSYSKKYRLVNTAYLPLNYHYDISLKRINA